MYSGKYDSFIGKKYFTDTIPETTQILELIVKDIKLTALNMFSELKTTMDKD